MYTPTTLISVNVKPLLGKSVRLNVPKEAITRPTFSLLSVAHQHAMLWLQEGTNLPQLVAVLLTVTFSMTLTQRNSTHNSYCNIYII